MWALVRKFPAGVAAPVRKRTEGSNFGLLHAISKATGVSRMPGEVSTVWRAGGPGKTKALLWEAIRQAHCIRRRGHAAAAAHVSGTGGFAHQLFSPRHAARPLREATTNRSTSSPGSTARPRGSDIPRGKTTFTNTRARNFFLSASTSSRISRWRSGNSSPAAIAAAIPRPGRAWPGRPIPATSATPG